MSPSLLRVDCEKSEGSVSRGLGAERDGTRRGGFPLRACDGGLVWVALVGRGVPLMSSKLVSSGLLSLSGGYVFIR